VDGTGWLVTLPDPTPRSARPAVRRTAKLFVGGAFPRSESGRTYAVAGAGGEFLANVAHASRKDARDAVRAARAAQPGWASRTAYNRGQVLYRVAEMMQGRRAQLVSDVREAEGQSPAAAEDVVDAAIDRWVWYAGWTDKLANVAGATNAVAGPYVNFSVPVPTGVVAVLAPSQSSLLGLVSVLAPALVPGNTAVVVTSHDRPLPAVTLAEVLVTSDVPGGVVNLLTGDAAEIAPWLASHDDVNALDLTGADGELAVALEREAAGTLKRVLRPGLDEWLGEQPLRRITGFTETRTVWHPAGV
jgi:acyl-CoA reductase-like NAD-dependent aldehyde dehydrogenase